MIKIIECETILPVWFISQCAPEPTEEGVELECEAWKKLTYQEKIEEMESEIWAVGDWLYWFELENRTWFWWDAEIIDNSTFVIYISVIETPGATGALQWLLRAAGATRIDFDE